MINFVGVKNIYKLFKVMLIYSKKYINKSKISLKYKYIFDIIKISEVALHKKPEKTLEIWYQN